MSKRLNTSGEEIGEVAYTNYIGVSLFWLKAEAMVNPEFVSD